MIIADARSAQIPAPHAQQIGSTHPKGGWIAQHRETDLLLGGEARTYADINVHIHTRLAT
jgi:hypothetical protein